jgi:hypothetical protein
MALEPVTAAGVSPRDGKKAENDGKTADNDGLHSRG